MSTLWHSEHCADTWESATGWLGLSFNPMKEFSILSKLLSRCACTSPRRFCRTTLCGVLSTPWLTETFCNLLRHTIVKSSLDGVGVFLVGPFFRAWLHDCCSSESRIQGLRWRHGFSGRTHGLREDFIFLPQLQQAIPMSQELSQSAHCCSDEFSQSSNISVLFMSANKSCDSLLNLLIILRLAQVLKDRFFVLVALELLINFLTLFSRVVSYCPTVESGMPGLM